jgi:hypothetical protein
MLPENAPRPKRIALRAVGWTWFPIRRPASKKRIRISSSQPRITLRDATMAPSRKISHAATTILFSLIMACLLGFAGDLLGMYACHFFQPANNPDDTNVYLCGLLVGTVMAIGGGVFSLSKSTGTTFQQLLERRWVLFVVAAVIGLASLLLFSITVQNAYLEYLVYPREKAADGYSYPQLRYAIFDSVLLLWCLDGFAACGLSLWSLLSMRSIAGWAYRTIVIYLVLFGALFAGGIFMIIARSRGL